MSEAVLQITTMEARAEIERLVAKEPNASLEDRARVAMQAAKGGFMAPADNEAFLAACEALAGTGSPEEFERIKAELEAQARVGAVLNALSSGVPVDLEAAAAEATRAKEENEHERIGLRQIWFEVNA